MEVKTIKGVDEYTWQKLKYFEKLQNKKMGAMLKLLVRNYDEKTKVGWNAIKSCEKVLSDKEARDLLMVSKEIRKARGLRV